MTPYTVTGIPGDGIGPEIMEAAVRVLDAAGAPIAWEWVEAGESAVKKYGTPLPVTVLESIRKNTVALKAPVTTPIGTGFRSVNVSLRRDLTLYAQVRPVRSVPGASARYSGVDIIIVRENTEGLYSGLEHEISPGVVESFKVVTSEASRRIARFAFSLAEREGRRRVTVLHKANILKLSDGLFLRTVREEAALHERVEYEEMLVDNASMKLVLDPGRFDVILADSFLGDIISEECAGLVGGAGLVPGYNIGDGLAVFEALHGSAPDIAGKGAANPTALILSSALMMRHLGEGGIGEGIERAVFHTIDHQEALTPDLGGRSSTAEFTEAVVSTLKRLRRAA